jgi:hypothetical protein
VVSLLGGAGEASANPGVGYALAAGAESVGAAVLATASAADADDLHRRLARAHPAPYRPGDQPPCPPLATPLAWCSPLPESRR